MAVVLNDFGMKILLWRHVPESYLGTTGDYYRR